MYSLFFGKKKQKTFIIAALIIQTYHRFYFMYFVRTYSIMYCECYYILFNLAILRSCITKSWKKKSSTIFTYTQNNKTFNAILIYTYTAPSRVVEKKTNKNNLKNPLIPICIFTKKKQTV